jgi:hypothetical protein
MAVFKCIATYGSKPYTSFVTLYDDIDPVQLTVIASEGNVFKNAVGANKTVTVTAMRNGLPMDISSGYECRWILRKDDGSIDGTFVDSGKSYRVGNPLTVTPAQVTNVANLVVELWTTT